MREVYFHKNANAEPDAATQLQTAEMANYDSKNRLHLKKSKIYINWNYSLMAVSLHQTIKWSLQLCQSRLMIYVVKDFIEMFEVYFWV